MNGLGLRQANAWLHTWSGLLLGWLMYLIFATGTLSFFRDEISFWMQPEQHASVPDAHTAERAVAAMQNMAPDASRWSISLPGPRESAVRVQWFDQGERPSKFGGHRAALDAGTAEILPQRDTRGADFLYRFHFELYGLPRVLARWIVGIATMMMLVAIVSGVITHKKIFTDFFTFRPRKGQRSWMDAHNALAVLSLPFHFMITYSGLLLLMFLLMPWGVQSAYDGDMRAYFNERGGRTASAAAEEAGPRSSAELAPIAPLMAKARSLWPRGVDNITIISPGRDNAVVELRERGGDSLLDRGRSEHLRFDGVSGALLESPAPSRSDAVTATYNVFTSLHLLRFAGPWLRWVFFIAGLLGTAMVATGLVLWVVKRLPQRRKHGSHIGHHLVERLNVATIAGLPLAVGAYFWANRLLPIDMAARANGEILTFFCAWALCLVHACLRTHRRAWLEQLAAIGFMYFLLPVYGMLCFDAHLVSHIQNGNWLLASVDLTLWAIALLALSGLGYLRSKAPGNNAAHATAKPARERVYAGS